MEVGCARRNLRWWRVLYW